MDDPQKMFTERYQSGHTPWDTGITPPEIVAIVAELAPGKAIDLGCGTGTNVRYLLEHGWLVDGVDFVPQAIETARARLAGFAPERYTVLAHDVTRLEEAVGLRPPYDLVVDIGCGHSTPPDRQEKYARDVAGLLNPGGTFMLYTHFPAADHRVGWTDGDVQRLFGPHFAFISQVLSTDTTNGRQSGWFRMERKDG